MAGLLLLAAAPAAPAAPPPAAPVSTLAVERLPPSYGESGEVLLVRLDPSVHVLRVVEAPGSTAAAVARERGALAVLNGGFFDDAGKPLGLLVTDGRCVSPVARRGWATFTLRGGRASVQAASATRSDVDQGVQAGPRLVVDGRVPGLRSAARARRSFVGVDGEGRIALGWVAEPVTLGELARRLARPPSRGGAGLVQALNLDGGSSTQAFVRAAGGDLVVPGLPVPDFLVVEPAVRSSSGP